MTLWSHSESLSGFCPNNLLHKATSKNWNVMAMSNKKTLLHPLFGAFEIGGGSGYLCVFIRQYSQFL